MYSPENYGHCQFFLEQYIVSFHSIVRSIDGKPDFGE